MFRFSILAPLFLVVFTVSACGTHNVFSDGSPQLVADPDKVSSLLANAADRAATSLETLASVEYARSSGVAVAPIQNAPAELRRAITVNWVGPAEPVIKMMADRAGYVFTVIGTPPPTAIVVSVNAENKSVIDVLRDIGLQLGLRADVKVDGATRQVEIHYAPNTGVGG